MKVRIAYLDEPPFYWTGPDGSALGADIELADVVLRAIGVTAVEHHKTSFEELLPGVRAGRWDMNVPIFVTPERARLVAFSVPVWTMVDGFVVHRGNPKALDSYVHLPGLGRPGRDETDHRPVVVRQGCTPPGRVRQGCEHRTSRGEGRA